MGMAAWNEAPLGTTLVFRNTDAAVIADGVTPQSGQFVLRLGGPSTDYLTHYVEQYIDIPPDATEVTVSGYLQVRTLETENLPNDKAYVVIAEEPQFDPPFFLSMPWSNLTPATSWTAFAVKAAVASVAGKQMVLRIIANLDTSIATYFYFDAISAVVTGCSP
jgi:hypothetical protein